MKQPEPKELKFKPGVVIGMESCPQPTDQVKRFICPIWGVGNNNTCAKYQNTSMSWQGCEVHKTTLACIKMFPFHFMFIASELPARPQITHLTKMTGRVGEGGRGIAGHAACAQVKTTLCSIISERCWWYRVFHVTKRPVTSP